jgi:predicted nucleic acid-binding Zn ribbon protein
VTQTKWPPANPGRFKDIKFDSLEVEAEDTRHFKVGSPTKCFLCRASYLYCGSVGDDSGRFCSDRCRDAYDFSGLRYRSPEARFTHADGHLMPPVAGGFRVACRSCGVQFNSNGLAFCSDDCRRLGEARQEAKAAGHEPRKGRTCIDCGSRIPRYTSSGRATKANVVRCTGCQRKTARAAQTA